MGASWVWVWGGNELGWECPGMLDGNVPGMEHPGMGLS